MVSYGKQAISCEAESPTFRRGEYVKKQIEDNLKKALINVQPYEKKLIKENILSTDIIHIYKRYGKRVYI